MELTSQRRALTFSELSDKKCSDKRSNSRSLTCTAQIESMIFFEALIQAAKTYDWKPETKIKAVKLAGDYIRFHLKEPNNLISVSILTMIFTELAEKGFAKNDITSPLLQLSSELDQKVNERKEAIKKFEFWDCKAALKSAEEERLLGNQYTEKLRQFEKDLP